MSISKRSRSARDDAGAAVTPVVAQGEWLHPARHRSARAGTSRAPIPNERDDIEAALNASRADEMGTLFKVIAIHSPDWPAPAGLR